MLSTYERRRFQRDVINEMPLYPTEGVLWDDNQIPSVNYSGETCLALPKLNLQFLTAHDYLLRNFNLFRYDQLLRLDGHLHLSEGNQTTKRSSLSKFLV
jgi:intron-binding protein aquarius